MRWLFFLVIILLFELVTYGAARGVLWWAGNLLTGRAARQVMISLFVLSNAVLVFGMARLSSFGLKLSNEVFLGEFLLGSFPGKNI